jgi:aldehyde dehydrogenase (NAD+)
MGPIATESQLQRVKTLLIAAQRDGATVATGGTRADVAGYPGGFFFRPTVLTNVSNQDMIAQTEVFGPVLVPISFEDEADAIRLANDSRYGLAAGIWTQSLDRAHRVAHELEAGMLWLNTYKAIAYTTPFGGFKDSGVGRLNGKAAVEEFLQTKTIWHQPADA